MSEFKFRTRSDAGSLRIGSLDLQFCLPNGFGDGENEITILEEPEGRALSGDLLAVLSVRSNQLGSSTFLWPHDCDDPDDSYLYQFPLGRWLVLRPSSCHFTLVRVSEETRL